MATARSGSGDPGIGTLLPLKEALDPAIAGRKAAALATLLAQGFPVPEGWVIPAELAERIAAGRDVREYAVLVDALPDTPLAVRSSGIAEDGDDVSLAGQYESLLNVRGTENVLEAVRAVWLSGQHLHLASLRAPTLGKSNSTVIPTAILIQPMLHPDAAGVAFSANPVTGDRNETVINAVAGLGDRLMAGETDPETWTVRGEAANRDDVDQPVLDESQARRVAELAHRAESAFGKPQDIEWAIVADELFLLQARPITALPVRPDFPPLPPGTWIKETQHFIIQVSVLQASVYVPRFQVATREMCSSIGSLLDRLQLVDRGGELYIQAVPLGDRHGAPPPGWLLGLIARIHPTFRSRVQDCARAMRGEVPKAFIERWETEWKSELRSRGRALLSVDLPSLSDQALTQHLVEARELVWSGMRVHFLLTSPTILYPYQLVELCNEFFGWDDTQALMLIAESASASSEPVRALDRLCESAAGRPDVLSLLSMAETTLDDIKAADSSFATEIDEYLSEYGHRSLENEISMPTLYERRDLLLSLIRERIESSARETSTGESLQQKQRDRADDLLRLRSADDRRRFQRVLELAERANAAREEKVLCTMYLSGSIIRYAMLESGTRLAARGTIARVDDIFFLTYDEVLDALRDERSADLKPVIAARRAERAWVAANPGPAILGDPPAELDPSWLPEPVRTVTRAFAWHIGGSKHVGTAKGGCLSGVGVSAGRYRGPVRILRDQTDFQRLKPGDVLVCPVTTSAWGILFGTAGALVTDHGGVLSHPAIAAREHGLPAVVGTLTATSELRDGQIVVVDGSTGEVELIEAP